MHPDYIRYFFSFHACGINNFSKERQNIFTVKTTGTKSERTYCHVPLAEGILLISVSSTLSEVKGLNVGSKVDPAIIKQ